MPKRDRPDKPTKAFFRMVLEGHSKVIDVVEKSYRVFEAQLLGGSKVTIYLTDVYTIGMAEYLRIVTNNEGVNFIVAASDYNSYTQDAKNQAIEDKVGLYKIKEFMGALNRAEFWNYGSPKSDHPKKLGAVQRIRRVR